ncbi:fimbrial protein [Cupriavidus sp. 30B13]|uniref:fimbrial protein n=1 Tax=Cupriavidus sp. 30B13 TaxID=3384241 RepID=UPI003B91CF55
MKKTIFATAIAAAAAAAAFAPAAQAAGDGTISFQGNVVATTCVINGGNKDLNVTLPAVSASVLKDAGSTAGRTPFTIKLSGCTGSSTTVSTAFEAGSTVNQNTGRLVVDNAATKVEIGLLNDKYQPIKAGAAQADQNSQVVALDAAGTELNYFAEYVSLGDAAAGAANSRIQYSLVYQ